MLYKLNLFLSLKHSFFIYTCLLFTWQTQWTQTLTKLQFIYFTPDGHLYKTNPNQPISAQLSRHCPITLQDSERFRFKSGWSAQVSKWTWIVYSSHTKRRLFLYSAWGGWKRTRRWTNGSWAVRECCFTLDTLFRKIISDVAVSTGRHSVQIAETAAARRIPNMYRWFA